MLQKYWNSGKMPITMNKVLRQCKSPFYFFLDLGDNVNLFSSKDLENVAYESLDKILLILDNERELQNIERELEELNRERGIEPEDDDGER